MSKFGGTSLIRRLQRLGFSTEDAGMIASGVAPGGGSGGEGEATGPVLFRGEWAPDTLTYSTANFSPGGSIAPYTEEHAGAGTVTAIDDGIKVTSNRTEWQHSAKATIELADIDLEGGALSRVTFDLVRAVGSGTSSAAKRNGVAVQSGQANDGPTPFEFVGVAPTDVFTFEMFGQFGVGDPTGGHFDVLNFKVFTAAAPYMMGEFVVHENHMYRSEVDNNASEPGVADWELKI